MHDVPVDDRPAGIDDRKPTRIIKNKPRPVTKFQIGDERQNIRQSKNKRHINSKSPITNQKQRQINTSAINPTKITKQNIEYHNRIQRYVI